MKRNRKYLAALGALVLVLLSGAGLPRRGAAEAPEAERPSLAWFEEKGLTLGESSLSYPALREGLCPAEITEAVNERILEDGDIRTYAGRISQLLSGGKLKVTWRGCVLGPVFSFSVAAEGAVKTPRNTHVRTGGSIDLRDGHEITPEEIWTDPEAAREKMEAWLEEEAAPELSAHLLNSSLTPLPDRFWTTERGVIFLYPVDQLSTLSDRAGDVLIPWEVTAEELDLAEDGIPAAMGVPRWLSPETEEDRAALAKAVEAAVSEGCFPGIPARLGDSVQALTEEWHLLIDPDVYVQGRFFSLEGAPFRQVYLMTDFLSEGWEHSVVDGIRADCGSLYGLTVGRTEQADWRQALGEPDHTIDFDEEQAEAYRTVAGSRDYYVFGTHRLQLHADGEGKLVSILLSE